MKTLINGMKYSWCYALALRYRKRLNNAKFDVAVEIVKSVSVSVKFSQQA